MFFIKLLSKLPTSLLYLISDVIYLLVFYAVKYRKKVVLQNLKNAFPEKNDAERLSIAKEFYQRFCEYSVEAIRAYSISADEMKARVKFINVEAVEEYAAKEQSIILAGSHQFNWEWALLTGCLVLPFPVDAVYKKLSNQAFDELMRQTRGKFGGKPIESKSIIRSLIKSKDRVKAVAIMADQSPKRNDPLYWAEFMNQETAFFTGLQQLSFTLKYPVFFYRMIRVKRGHYNVELIKIGDAPSDKTSFKLLDNYVSQVQQLVSDEPASYLWTHKRWKFKRQ